MGQIRLATLTKLQKNVEKVSTTPKKPKKKKTQSWGAFTVAPSRRGRFCRFILFLGQPCFLPILMAQPAILDKQIAGYWMGFWTPSESQKNLLHLAFSP